MKKIIKFFKELPRWVKSRYSITALVFFSWMLLFDQNDVFTQMELRTDLKELEKTREYYKEEIITTNKDLEDLLTNKDNLERFAREKYLMKKDNEEIFVLVYEED
jgi:cell division protein DivIC